MVPKLILGQSALAGTLWRGWKTLGVSVDQLSPFTYALRQIADAAYEVKEFPDRR